MNRVHLLVTIAAWLGFCPCIANARLFDSELGRWTRRDPHPSAQASSLQEYVHGDPLGATDPEGLVAARQCMNPRPDTSIPPPTPNGCGGAGSAVPVPDGFGKCNFKPWCDNHDLCYATCGANKQLCDDMLCTNLFAECGRCGKNLLERLACMEAAAAYCAAVTLFGQGWYDAAQERFCICCDPPTPDPGCWGPFLPSPALPAAPSPAPASQSRGCAGRCR